MITNLKTDPALLGRLRSVAGMPMSAEEIDAQRVSFIYGQLDGRVTHEQIISVLSKQAGVAS